MVGGVKQLLLICAVVALVGCGKKEQAKATPDASANKLFVEAVQLITSAEEQTGEAAIKDYEQALGKLGEIIANYSESDLAVKLISGETLFTGKSLKEIKERVKELRGAEAKREAEAEAAKAEARAAAEVKAARDAKVIEAAIRKELKKPTGELTEADLEKVTFLDLGTNKLTDVPKGLEKLTQLKSLSLNVNQLTSVKGLEKLTQLTYLYLISNYLTDVKGLEKLTQLTSLGLHFNKLTSVEGLEKLTQLTFLNLNDNQLTDVTGLEKLTQLTELHLHNNSDLTKAQINELQKVCPIAKSTATPSSNRPNAPPAALPLTPALA